MNLVCPPGSYDANVEPAKDDVLFTDPHHVLGLVESFFRSHYGELKPNDKSTMTGKRPSADSRSFDLLLARKPSAATVYTPLSTAQSESFPSSALKHHLEGTGHANAKSTKRVDSCHGAAYDDAVDPTTQASLRYEAEELEVNQSSSARPPNGISQLWCRSMYPGGVDEEFANPNSPPPSQISDEEEDIRDMTATNPWTLAKLNAPIRRQSQAEHNSNGTGSSQQVPTLAKGSGNLLQDLSSPVRIARPDINHGLPTPAKSQNATTEETSSPDRFPYPMKAWGKARGEADSSPHRVSDEGQSSSSAMLDAWVQRPPLQGRDELFLPVQHPTVPRPRLDFVSASTLSQGTPLSAIPDISQKPRQREGPRKQQRPPKVNKPFTPPVRDPHRVWFDHLEPSTTRASNASQQRGQHGFLGPDTSLHPPTRDLANDPIISSSSPPLPHHPGLALTMDYEKRKAEATAARRALLRQQQQQQNAQSQPSTNVPASSPTVKISPSQQSQPSLLSSSPHRNRYRSAVAALHTPSQQQHLAAGAADSWQALEQVQKMDPVDPRAYLIRSRDDTGRVKRTTKTALLPLESVS
ncbi:MAG: hypothetical protein L6R39_002522, partial [Caloplaca ligustica]